MLVTGDKRKTIAHHRAVKLGDAYGNLIAVLGGVEASDQVVVQGAAFVKDGEQVQVIE